MNKAINKEIMDQLMEKGMFTPRSDDGSTHLTDKGKEVLRITPLFHEVFKKEGYMSALCACIPNLLEE